MQREITYFVELVFTGVTHFKMFELNGFSKTFINWNNIIFRREKNREIHPNEQCNERLSSELYQLEEKLAKEF